MTKFLAEYFMREDGNEFWIDIRVDRKVAEIIGPFDNREECERAYDDLLNFARRFGAIDLPSKPQ